MPGQTASVPLRRQHRAAALVAAPLLAACASPAGQAEDPPSTPEPGVVEIPQVLYASEIDPDTAPAAEVELPDGRALQVTAEHAALREDVEVRLHPHEEGQIVMVTSPEEDIRVSAEDPSEFTQDGVALLASPVDLPYERGEIEYAEPPTVTSCGSPQRCDGAGGSGGRRCSDRLCGGHRPAA